MIQYPHQFGGAVSRILESGTGSETIALVHGVCARADRWIRILDPLGDAGYHVFAPDLPGHGLAEKGKHLDCSVPNYAQALNTFLDENNSSSVTLIGTSLGGHVAASAACAQPDRVRGLVLIGTLGIVPLGEERRSNMRTHIMNTSLEGIRAKFRSVMHDHTLVTEDLVLEEWQCNNSPGALEAFHELASYFEQHIDNDLVGEDLCSSVNSFPTLIVWGRQDEAVPLDPIGFQTNIAIPGSTLAIIDDTAHAPYYERPTTFLKVLTDFLDGTLGQIPIEGVELL
jgi:pimeloyl-ACP methyl ester carboxylesterase